MYWSRLPDVSMYWDWNMRVLRPRYLLEVLLVDVFLHRLSITRGQGVALITLSSCFRGYDRWLLTKEVIKDC
jgi:hypothetical protein